MHSRRFLPPSLVTALLAALALVIIATGLPLRASSAPIRLTSLNDTANMPSNVENLTNVGGVAYFHVRTGMGSQLWRSDGTSQGTRPVDVGLGAVEIRIPYRVGGKLLLFAPDSSSTNTLGLYVAQSEPGTASLLKGELAVVEGPTGAAFGVVNGTLIFAVRNAGGADLWRSDGTAAGTQFVTRISTDTEAFLRNVAVIDNLVYFFSSADTAPTTYRLWRSDGTAAGTFVLSNAFQQDEFSTSFQLVGLNGIVYFGAKGTGGGVELWRSDGSILETKRVATIIAPPADGVLQLAPGATKLFFFASGPGGVKLWVSNGTEAGTQQAFPSPLQSTWFAGSDLVAAGDVVLFKALGDSVVELWRSDGTTTGTFPMSDVLGDAAALVEPHRYAQVGDVVLLSAYQPNGSSAIWQTNGTAAGTKIAAELAPPPQQIDPARFTVVGDTVFFTNQADRGGTELWAMPLTLFVPAPTATPTLTVQPDPMRPVVYMPMAGR
jgi:ELWxxDGT repeat protein